VLVYSMSNTDGRSSATAKTGNDSGTLRRVAGLQRQQGFLIELQSSTHRSVIRAFKEASRLQRPNLRERRVARMRKDSE